MDHRDEIKDLTRTVYGGLTIYIAFHNKISRHQATIKSFLKNLLGWDVPFSKLLEDSEKLLPLWDAILQKMEVFRQSAYPSLSKDEKYYFDILSRYVDAVRKTVIVLIDRQRLLNEGSKGGLKNPMTWEAWRHKDRSYKTAIQEYMAIGQELNDAWPRLLRTEATDGGTGTGPRRA
jgi:hypothetical protein